MGEKLLGSFEERVLLAVCTLQSQDEAYGLAIQDLMATATGQPPALGAIYTTLDRLENKGYLESWKSEPRPERGGRSRRLFRLTGLGERALDLTQQARAGLRLSVAGGGML